MSVEEALQLRLLFTEEETKELETVIHAMRNRIQNQVYHQVEDLLISELEVAGFTEAAKFLKDLSAEIPF